MTDTQLYLALGIPRMTSLESRMLALKSSMNTRFDLIMGRLANLDTRLSVREDRTKR
jgi:hypothetical protein